jgi:quinol monooxygenase YgiN
VSEVYTSGEWIAKPGKEAEFVQAWRDLAEWTIREVPGASRVQLLRDTGDPRRFRSIGPWESPETVASWRALQGFRDRITDIKALVESFDAQVLEPVIELG